MGIKYINFKRYELSFAAYKDPLAGYREIFLLPTISTIDTLWLRKDTRIERSGIGLGFRWLRFEVGIRLFWEKKK